MSLCCQPRPVAVFRDGELVQVVYRHDRRAGCLASDVSVDDPVAWLDTPVRRRMPDEVWRRLVARNGVAARRAAA